MSITPSVAVDTVENSSMPISNGKTLYVGGSGEGNYSKIQDAINDSFDADKVYVYNGTYYEHLQINKQISLMGEYNLTTRIIGNDTGDIINITADGVSINGFTIDSGKPYHTNFYGIICNGSNTSIVNNHIISNYWALKISHASNNIVQNNYLSINYWTIIFYFSSNNLISENYIVDSWFSNHDCIKLSNCNNNKVYNNTMINNGNDLIVLIKSSNNTITYNNILKSCLDDGITLKSNSNNNYISNNYMNEVDNGISVESSSVDNTIISNEIINSYYGIKIYAKNNIISENYIDNAFHGGIFVKSYNNTIINNYINYSIGNGIELSAPSIYPIEGNTIIDTSNGIYIGCKDNLIFYNTIKSCWRAIYIDKKSDNKIFFNNFIACKKEPIYFQFESTNPKPWNNEINRNYWGRPRIFPKIIFGVELYFSGIILWRNEFYIPFLMVDFDWHPALLPYKIEVVI